MLSAFIGLIEGFAGYIRDNGGTGDFSNFERVFGIFGDIAEGVDGFFGS